MRDIIRKARELAESGDIGGASETVLELLEHVKEIQRDRDAALERVRVLEEAISKWNSLAKIVSLAEDALDENYTYKARFDES